MPQAGECDWIAVHCRPDGLRGWALSRTGEVVARAGGPASSSRCDRAALVAPWRAGGRSVPVLVAGAPGAPLAPVPCPPLPETLPAADDGGFVALPGLSQAEPADFTRGEEVQIAGLLAEVPQFDGVLCLPDRVSRWLRVSAGEVVGFASYLTGAAIEALGRSPELAEVVAPAGSRALDVAAFEQGLDEAMAAPARVLSRLAGLEGARRLAGLGAQAARARLQGLLIGQEIAAAKSWWLGMQVAVLGEPPLAELYGRALRAQGVEARLYEAEAALLAGFRLLRARL